MAVNVNEVQSQSVNNILPTIKVVGVGGGGGNVVNRMVNDGVKGVQYIAANTDVMVLNSSKADITIPLGAKNTKGLGAGMKPEVGKAAAEEDLDTIKSVLEDTDLIFVSAGMGGGTGTGAAPVVAEIAKEMKILTVGVVTTPFRFEGSKRARIANEGIEELKKHVDTLMVIPNNKLLEMASPKTTMNEAFSLADDVLKQAISGITDLLNREGVINLDFADLKTVMSNKGRAIMGQGVGTGENRGLEAAQKAVSSPLLSDTQISGATGVIINIVADENFSLLDAQAAADFIQGSADQDADVIFGLVTDNTKDNEVIITVIATGFDNPFETQEEVKHESGHPLRVIDSMRHQNPEKMKQLHSDSPAPEIREEVLEEPEPIIVEEPEPEDVLELDPEIVGLKQVEDTLHYPNQMDSHTGSSANGFNPQEFDVPAFMRKKRLKN